MIDINSYNVFFY